MRHYFKFRLFNSKISKRKSIFNNLCISIIKYENITTSIFKAKEIRIFIEPLVTISKNYSDFNFKFLYKKLKNLEAVLKLFKIIGPRYKYRNGGYTRIYKINNLKNNSTNTGIIEFC